MTKKIPDTQRRLSINFAEELDNIKIDRIKLGIDKKMLGDCRLTDAMIKQPEWKNLKIKLAKLPRDPELDRKRIR